MRSSSASISGVPHLQFNGHCLKYSKSSFHVIQISKDLQWKSSCPLPGSTRSLNTWLTSSFTWNEDEQVRRAARGVVNLIADHRGGQLSIFQVVKLKYRLPQLLQYELFPKIREEIRVFPIDGLSFWLTITRLVKENIVSLVQDRLKIWLQIPQVQCHMFLD